MKKKFKILKEADLNLLKGGNAQDNLSRPATQFDINDPNQFLPSACDKAGQN